MSRREVESINREIRARFGELRNKLKDLPLFKLELSSQLEAEDFDKEIQVHNQRFYTLQSNLKEANLDSLRKRTVAEKSELLSSNYKSSGDGDLVLPTRERVVETAGNLTENISELNRMVAEEVKRMNEANAVLSRSSRQVVETQREFRTMSAHVKDSERLLSRFGRRLMTDKVLILLAVLFFVAACLYVVKKRVPGLGLF